MNDMCKGKDKVLPCDIWTKNDGKETNINDLWRWYFKGSHLIPKGKREWFKLAIDIVFLIFFIVMVTSMGFFYNDGYKVGYSVCKNELTTAMMDAYRNFTNGTGMMSPTNVIPSG